MVFSFPSAPLQWPSYVYQSRTTQQYRILTNNMKVFIVWNISHFVAILWFLLLFVFSTWFLINAETEAFKEEKFHKSFSHFLSVAPRQSPFVFWEWETIKGWLTTHIEAYFMGNHSYISPFLRYILRYNLRFWFLTFDAQNLLQGW